MTDPLIEDDASPVRAVVITFVILVSLAIGTLFIPRAEVHAQGTFANTTVSVPVLTNFAGTGAFGCPTSGLGGGQCQGITQGVFPNIGGGSHWLHYCTSATALQIQLQESPDAVSGHYAAITPIYGVPAVGSCGVIQGGGYFQNLQGNILSQSGGSTSVWYSASAGPVSTFPTGVNSVGATSPVQCDKSLTSDVAAGALVSLIAGVSGKRIFLCGGTYSFNAATTTGGISLAHSNNGIGTCNPFGLMWNNVILSTTPQQITPFNFTSGALIIPNGESLCVLTGTITATTTIDIAYAQL